MTSITRQLWTVVLVTCLGLASTAALADDDDRDDKNRKSPTILDIVLDTKGAEALVAAVLLVDDAFPEDRLPGLLGNKRKKLVLLAPSNAAFEKLLDPDPPVLPLDEVLDKVEALDPEDVRTILLRHVTKPKKRLKLKKVSESALLRKGEIMTIDGCVRPVGVGGSGVEINQEATIIKADVVAKNGVIHFIDTVITADFASNGDPFCP